MTMNWISLKERTPPSGTEVLVGWDGPRHYPSQPRVASAYYTWHADVELHVFDGAGRWVLGDTGAPTHWAELPEPPVSRAAPPRTPRRARSTPASGS
jgi:hypothetical protein